jgi:transcription antitermination protein NusB
MGQRHQARCVVLEVLYSIDIGGPENMEGNLQFCATLHKLTDDGLAFSRRLLKAVVDNSAEIDVRLKGLLTNWNIERLAIVDKNVLRLGLGEIKYVPETPIKVAIDEAIELAKKYGSADSGRFVNGILDAAGALNGEVND